MLWHVHRAQCPGHDVHILLFQKRFEPRNVRIAPALGIGRAKAADHIVSLPRAAMFGAELQAFQAADVTCPLFTTERPALDDPEPWWGRKRIHTQGRDICMLPARPRGWKRSEFWVAAIYDVAQEFRVHVFAGKSIARAEKVPANSLDATQPPPTCMRRRSRRFGWRLRHGCEMPQAVRDIAKRAVAACGYDFGAVDVLWTGRYPVVLEVNRAPGLDTATTSAYIAALERKVSAT